jgi:predicted nucleotidyltransferase component of viral defense system
MNTKMKEWHKRYLKYLLPIKENFIDVGNNLCFIGGTALSLFYLKHRISEDLDFMYLNESFDYRKLFKCFKKTNYLCNHVETLYSSADQWFGERLEIIDGINKIKIDVTKNTLLDQFNYKNIDDLNVLSLSDIYIIKVQRLASQSHEDVFGFNQSRAVNVRDWIDVYEMSKTYKSLASLLLNDLKETANSDFIVSLEKSLNNVSRLDFKNEMDYLQYHRADKIKSADVIEHIRESIDTWHGYQFETRLEPK